MTNRIANGLCRQVGGGAFAKPHRTTLYAKQSSLEKLHFEEGSSRNCLNRVSSPFTSYMNDYAQTAVTFIK